MVWTLLDVGVLLLLHCSHEPVAIIAVAAGGPRCRVSFPTAFVVVVPAQKFAPGKKEKRLALLVRDGRRDLARGEISEKEVGFYEFGE
jgi:phosphohistidine phosphatase SixA